MSYYDLSDELWQRLEPVLPTEGSPKGGRPAKDQRVFVNAIVWLLRTGAPWRALPEEYGSWNSMYSRFRRRQAKGFWKAIFQALSVFEKLKDDQPPAWFAVGWIASRLEVLTQDAVKAFASLKRADHFWS